MNISEIFVRKPVLTTLLALCLTLLGIQAYRVLPVSNLPNVQFPYIVINAFYPGNSPLSMAANVARPIEEAVMSIEGLQQVTSTNRQGVTQVVLTFKIDQPLSEIVQGVQTALSQAQVDLPPDLPAQPTFQKINPSLMPVYFIALTSDELNQPDLYSIGGQTVSRRLSNIDGVGSVIIFGVKPAVRVQIDPGKLAARGLSLAQIQSALVAGNPSIPSGRIDGPFRSFTIETDGQLRTAEEFGEVVVAHVNGAPLRVRDLGDAVASVENVNFAMEYRASEGAGKSSVIVAVAKQSTANTVSVARDIEEAMAELGDSLPATVRMSVLYDASLPILTSIDDVTESLIIAFVLVVLVIFIFLARVRETIVPAVALPLSMLGTFVAMQVCGFSLDMLSMLGLTLCVGFVVDDAIVVLENAVRQIEHGKKPFQAAIDSVHEISPTVLSMTLSLCAVFIPLIFMPGLVGKFLQEFSLTIVFAILVSGVVSLTVSPMMCARLLKADDGRPNRLKSVVDRVFKATVDRYILWLRWFIRHRWLALVASLFCVVGTGVLFVYVPKSFIPSGDTGALNGTLLLESGVSPAKRASVQKEAVGLMEKHPAVTRVLAYTGSTQNAENEISLLAILKPAQERADITTIATEINRTLAELPGVKGGVSPLSMLSFGASTSDGGGETGKRYTYQITGPDLDKVYAAAEDFVRLLAETPGFADPRADLGNDNPQLSVTIHRDRARALGVDPATIEQTLFLAYSGNKVTTIKTTTDQYDVILEVKPGFNRSPDDLGSLYVASARGGLVPLRAVASWKIALGPGKIQHDSLQNMVPITFGLKSGYSLGEATAAIDRLKKENLPAGVAGDFTGEAKMFVELGQSLLFLLVMAVFAMYLILAILYESYWDPVTVLSSLPLAGFGGVLTLLLFDVDFGLYAFVGLFLLLGIVKKNGIMMVDFARMHLLTERTTPEIAVLEASRERFRPIIMTTLAAVMGALPIALGVGASGKDYQSLGLTIAGGLMFSQLITLFVTPCIYLYVEHFREWVARRFFGATAAAPAASDA